MILIMEDTIQTFIETELLGPGAAGSLAPTDELLMSEMIDSMGAVRLIAFLEERFSVRIPPADITIENFSTVGRIAGLLERLVGESR